MLELVFRRAREFDVLHFHIDFHPFSLFSRQPVPFVSTLHGRMDQDWVTEIYDLFPERAAGLDLGQPAPADAASGLGGNRPARHAAGPAHPAPARTRATTWPSSAAFRRRRASRAPSVSPPLPACGSGSPPRSARRMPVLSRMSSRRCWKRAMSSSWAKSTMPAKAGLPLRRPRPAVPDRLAGAVRPGDDRGDGLRLSGDRLPPRQRARGGGGRRHRLRGRQRGRGGGGLRPRGRAGPRRGAPPLRATMDLRPDGGGLLSPCTSA